MLSPHPDFVEVELKYLANDKDLAVYIASTGGGDVTEHQGNYVMQPVKVQNARLREQEFDLDREGFVLTNLVSQVTDFYNDQQIVYVFKDEIKSLVKQKMGANCVEIFDYTRRSSSVEVQKDKQIREAASIIHNDYTAKSGPVRLRDHYSEEPGIAEKFLQGRFAVVNAWCSISGTVYDAPLAMCDASSVSESGLVPVERQAKERIGEIQLAIHEPSHRWYYFPQMQADEILLFKTYDSKDDGRARFTIHTSFDDPNAANDAPSRESIEVRCFVFF